MIPHILNGDSWKNIVNLRQRRLPHWKKSQKGNPNPSRAEVGAELWRSPRPVLPVDSLWMHPYSIPEVLNGDMGQHGPHCQSLAVPFPPEGLCATHHNPLDPGCFSTLPAILSSNLPFVQEDVMGDCVKALLKLRERASTISTASTRPPPSGWLSTMSPSPFPFSAEITAEPKDVVF